MPVTPRIGLALAAAVFSMGAYAQAFPTKPIRLVVPFPPGGGTDIVAREASQKVASETGWTFVVENRPGAGGNLGVDTVAKAPADGHTLVIGQTSNLAINPTLFAKMPYDVQKDLAPILLVAKSPLVMVTSSASPHKTLADVTSAAKARPGVFNFASPGNGTVSHLASELYQKAAGVKMQHVPYKGAAPAITDVIGGTVELYMSSVPTLIGLIKQGKLRPLAVTSTQRVDDLPSVPTLHELGYTGFEATTWFGFMAPAGTPKDVIARLNTEFNKALQRPDLRRKLSDEGLEPAGGTPEQFAAFIKDETRHWGKVIQDAGIKAE